MTSGNAITRNRPRNRKSAKAGESAHRRRILLLADFAYASGRGIASGIIRYLSAHSGIDLLLHGRTSEMPAMRKDLIPVSGIDGIVTCFGDDMAFMRKWLEAAPGVPAVLANVPRNWAPPEGRRYASIFCDHAAVAGAAAELLVRHGLAEFGYVGSRYPHAARTWDAERREAFRAALAERGFRVAEYLPPDGTDADAELASFASWLRALPKPCGILVSDDIRAMHVLNVCRAEGFAVPEQIQVVGVDNDELICGNTSPTLTSVEPDFEGCGRRAAETILAMMEPNEKWKMKNGKVATAEGSAAVPAEQTFGVRRVEQRMSTTDMHGSVNRAVRARKWLRANFSRKLEVSHVAARLGCSARVLQISYKAVFGRSMRDDLIDMRLEHARKLLADTDIPVYLIPERCGSDAPHHFLRMFKARTGMTMLQWRRNTPADPR